MTEAAGATVFKFETAEKIQVEAGVRDPQKHFSISILLGYPYLIGLHYKGVYMGYAYPNLWLCAFLGSLV